MAGATLWGRLADACGRRAGFFGTAVFTFAFGLASAGSPNYPVLPLTSLLGFFAVCPETTVALGLPVSPTIHCKRLAW